MADETGEGIAAAMNRYEQIKAQRSRIEMLCTDANSCYGLAFVRNPVPEKHVVTKAQTHRMESFNRSIRDNPARFNR
ncbi:MAG: hypothetical protein LBJ59_01615, partial [Zoogloeaceae bacterium]|nr:hypothetical protein [Zoogloeaceae bacterium]